MKKIFFIITLLAISCVMGFFSYVVMKRFYIKEQSRKLNLIIISVDALRTYHMCVYGYGKNTTPNIDSWAKQAFVFNSAQTVVPTTYPSFVALMTGQHPFTTRITANKYGEGQYIGNKTVTLAKVLNKYGFSTAAFFGNDALTQELTNLGQGFDIYKHVPAWNSRDYAYSDFGELPIDWLSVNKDKRFFLWVHLVDPHSPYEPPDDLACNFGEQFCDEIRKNGWGKIEELRKRYGKCPDVGQEPSDKTIEIMKSLYDS